MRTSIALLTISSLSLTPVAWGADSPERPSTPALSAVGDDGAWSMWHNPANLGLDQDEDFLFLIGQQINTTPGASPQAGPGTFAFASQKGPLSSGLHYTQTIDGSDWWALSTGLGLLIDENVALGVNMGWQIPDGPDNNFVTWDLGLTWRPYHWLAMGGVVQNLGDHDTGSDIQQRMGPSIALRPFGDRLLFGLDYVDNRNEGMGVAEASLVTKPMDGLQIRLSGDSNGWLGAGAEVFFGRGGAGTHAQAQVIDTGSPSVMAYARGSLPETTIRRTGKRVPEFRLTDAYPYQPPVGLFAQRTESYLQLLRRLQAATEDPTVAGLIIHLDKTPFSLAQIEELRALILQAKENGKPVLAYMGKAHSNGAYFLASAADKVYLHPAGELDIIGLSAELRFLRGTLDLIGVEPQFAKRAEYKGAPESYTNTEGSAANREQINALLDDLHGNWVQGIGEARGMTAEEVRALVDKGPFTGADALSEGLVDGLIYPNDLEEKYDAMLVDGYAIDEEYRTVVGMDGWPAQHAIAVIYIEGVIVSGQSAGPGFFGGGRTTGSTTVVQQLEQARLDRKVKGVLLRVDSPGGSAFASDEIWKAVEELQKDKPLIVSMGGAAASGGYYVSAGAHRIFANPSTITGSIGVFSGTFSLEGLYEKIGVKVERYNRGRNAAMYSSSKPMDHSEYGAMDRLVADISRQFKEKVKAGRALDDEGVENVARGRIWSGVAAEKNGLTDETGTLFDALEQLETEAEIPENADVQLIAYGIYPYVDGTLAERSVHTALQWATQARTQTAPTWLPAELAAIEQWHVLADDPVWAVLPYQLEIR